MITVNEIVLTCPPVAIEQIRNSTTITTSVQYPNATAVGGQGDIILLYSIPSGGDFYLGETIVAVTGIDSTGAVAQCTFPIFVVYQGMGLI